MFSIPSETQHFVLFCLFPKNESRVKTNRSSFIGEKIRKKVLKVRYKFGDYAVNIFDVYIKFWVFLKQKKKTLL